MNNRILYVTKIHFDSPRTHVYNIAKTSEALTENGYRVILLSTDTKPDLNEFFGRHHVETSFMIEGLGINFPGDVSRIRYALWLIKINLYLAWYIMWRRKDFDVLYSRDESLLLAIVVGKMLGKPFFFETHSVLVGGHRQLLNLGMLKLANGVIAISNQLKEYYQKYNPNILVSYCGADESYWIEDGIDKNELRKKLSLPQDKFLIGYAGVVGENPNGDVYEIDCVIESLTHLPENVVFVIVGEMHDNANWLRDIARKAGVIERVSILPWQERKRIPLFLASFDVVAIPRRKKDLASDSPLKMFTALSAGSVIVGSDSLAITEILHDNKNALIVKNNSRDAWAAAINVLYEDTDLRTRLSREAKKNSHLYTWSKRGIDIAAFINENTD